MQGEKEEKLKRGTCPEGHSPREIKSSGRKPVKGGEHSPYPALGAAEQTRRRAHGQAAPPWSGDGPATVQSPGGRGRQGPRKGPARAEQGSWACGQASGTLENAESTSTPSSPSPCTHLNLGPQGALSCQC